MANNTVPDTVLPPQSQELRISIWPDHFARFEGTAAQLVAEGLIPDGFEWPKAKTDKYWQSNGFKYWMRRVRPEGHSGPLRSWLEADNWFVRVTVEGRDQLWHERRYVERKAEELRKAAYQVSPVGKVEDADAFRRYLATIGDNAFQAFKDKVPALNPPKRPRKQKTRDATKPAQSS